MSNVPGDIPSAAAGIPWIPTKRTRLEYSTVAKTGYIDPATKNDYKHDMHYNDALEPLIDDILEWLNCKLGAHCRKEIIKKIRKSSKNKKHTKKNSNSNFKSIYNKVEDLELILNKTNPAVLCLQETHLSEKTSLLRLKGYTCVESKKNLTKTGLGLLIAVQNRSSCSISELRNEYSWMSVKINSKTASGKENEILIIIIHTPHIAAKIK
ncbi:hypothetical protein BB561_001028 [Smittium simulii]|uniref:Endonuclease/exonuclease/phosphatase domain-containing protein n=1 Tax=Smittium simulii TaxID=133385 RepID=A0A2T9YWL7_9FUNG|nr:hypothetical protein BB561_001028 [Smittium simulii]